MSKEKRKDLYMRLLKNKGGKRGALLEVARECGVTYQAIQGALNFCKHTSYQKIKHLL